jgi:hypothetical protein
VRATLNDELMREAGFESAFNAERARRREQRRRKLRIDVLRATRVLAFVGAVAGGVYWIVDVTGKTARLPRTPIFVVLVAAMVGVVAQGLEGRMTRSEGEQSRRPLLRVWRGITQPRPYLRRVWRGITRPWRTDEW